MADPDENLKKVRQYCFDRGFLCGHPDRSVYASLEYLRSALNMETRTPDKKSRVFRKGVRQVRVTQIGLARKWGVSVVALRNCNRHILSNQKHAEDVVRMLGE